MDDSSVLRKEEEILAAYQSLIDTPSAEVAPHQVNALVAHYAKLLKNYSRQLRISDKNEHRLHSISEELEVERKRMSGIAVQLSKYLPTQIYDGIFSGNQAFEIKTQRKLLTVFFSDIQGFTQISSILQPEVLTHYINRYFSELSAIAAKHGGTIDKYIGDAMMIFFGDPASRGAHEDALACVRMAVEMQTRLAELNALWKSEGLQYPLITRIGINTGWCNVGNFGSSDRMAYTIIGGEVNLAARIESKCEPGGVLMSFDTYALIKDHFAVEERELLQLKGISRPVQTYTVRRMLSDKEQKEQPIDLAIPGQEPIRIKTPDLTLPERLSLIEDLKRTVQKLEGVSHD